MEPKQLIRQAIEQMAEKALGEPWAVLRDELAEGLAFEVESFAFERLIETATARLDWMKAELNGEAA